MTRKTLWFAGTSRSGLGHLRRLSTIARAVRRLAPERRLGLVSNAPPEGLEAEDLAAFDTVSVCVKDGFAAAIGDAPGGTVVADTVTFPGIERVPARLVLVIREMPGDCLARVRLPGGRVWDGVIVANPAAHWMPAFARHEARAVCPVGWIYRPTGVRAGAPPRVAQVLVATGGGGTDETAGHLEAGLDRVLALTRRRSAAQFRVVQAIGPRARDRAPLREADLAVEPGGALNAHFREADAVLSTAGYNSVLELATTDTPVLLVPIPRGIDDQAARARAWGPLLGGWLRDDAPEAAADWLAACVDGRRRRPPVDLGPSGEDRAARIILGLP